MESDQLIDKYGQMLRDNRAKLTKLKTDLSQLDSNLISLNSSVFSTPS